MRVFLKSGASREAGCAYFSSGKSLLMVNLNELYQRRPQIFFSWYNGGRKRNSYNQVRTPYAWMHIWGTMILTFFRS